MKGLTEEQMARRMARAIPDGSIVNLGIGMATLVGDFLSSERDVYVQVENGALGIGLRAEPGEVALDLLNPSREHVTLLSGGSFFHHADAFAMIRGGHIDVSVMGALQVSEKGDLANWAVPGKATGGIGGAMDLAAGAKRVYILMTHTKKDGGPKILTECTYPLTAPGVVDLIITDLAVIEVAPEGLVLLERTPGTSVEEIQARTGASLIIGEEVGTIEA